MDYPERRRIRTADLTNDGRRAAGGVARGEGEAGERPRAAGETRRTCGAGVQGGGRKRRRYQNARAEADKGQKW